MQAIESSRHRRRSSRKVIIVASVNQGTVWGRGYKWVYTGRYRWVCTHTVVPWCTCSTTRHVCESRKILR